MDLILVSPSDQELQKISSWVSCIKYRVVCLSKIPEPTEQSFLISGSPPHLSPFLVVHLLHDTSTARTQSLNRKKAVGVYDVKLDMKNE